MAKDILLQCFSKNKITLVLKVFSVVVGPISHSLTPVFIKGHWHFGQDNSLLHRTDLTIAKDLASLAPAP